MKTVTTIPNTRRITMVVSRARPHFQPPLLLLECVLEPPITQSEILTCASLAHFVPAVDSSTVIRHRGQHCRGHLVRFQKMLVYLLLAYPKTQFNCFCQKSTGSYVVCGRFSRRSTGGWNYPFDRGFPQPSIDFIFFNGKNACFQRR